MYRRSSWIWPVCLRWVKLMPQILSEVAARHSASAEFFSYFGPNMWIVVTIWSHTVFGTMASGFYADWFNIRHIGRIYEFHWVYIVLYVVLELIAFPKGLQNVLTLWTKIMPFPQVASHGPHALQGLQSRGLHNYGRIKDLALLSLLWFESKQIKFNIQRGRYLATMYFLAGLYLAT